MTFKENAVFLVLLSRLLRRVDNYCGPRGKFGSTRFKFNFVNTLYE